MTSTTTEQHHYTKCTYRGIGHGETWCQSTNRIIAYNPSSTEQFPSPGLTAVVMPQILANFLGDLDIRVTKCFCTKRSSAFWDFRLLEAFWRSNTRLRKGMLPPPRVPFTKCQVSSHDLDHCYCQAYLTVPYLTYYLATKTAAWSRSLCTGPLATYSHGSHPLYGTISTISPFH